VRDTQIQFVRSGTFLGRAGRLTESVDTSALPEAEASELEELVDRLDLPKLAQLHPEQTGARDQAQYNITVVRGSQRYELMMADDQVPPELRRLIELLEGRARETRRRQSQQAPSRKAK
jgi:hypothetical protein